MFFDKFIYKIRVATAKVIGIMESDKFKQLSVTGYGCVMVLEERARNRKVRITATLWINQT